MIDDLAKIFIEKSWLKSDLKSVAKKIFEEERERIIMNYGDINGAKHIIILKIHKKEIDIALNEEKYNWLVYILHAFLLGSASRYAIDMPLNVSFWVDIVSIFERTGYEFEADRKSSFIDFSTALIGYEDKYDRKEYFKNQKWLELISMPGKFDPRLATGVYFDGLEDSWTYLLSNLSATISTLMNKFDKEYHVHNYDSEDQCTPRDLLHPNELTDYYSNIKDPRSVKDWLDSESYYHFLNIEKELLDQEIIDKQYNWKLSLRKLKDFSVILIDHFKVFKSVVKGKRTKPSDCRQFLSERYGYDKTKLNQSGKKHKPSIDKAKGDFQSWIDKVPPNKIHSKSC